MKYRIVKQGDDYMIQGKFLGLIWAYIYLSSYHRYFFEVSVFKSEKAATDKIEEYTRNNEKRKIIKIVEM